MRTLLSAKVYQKKCIDVFQGSNKNFRDGGAQKFLRHLILVEKTFKLISVS